MQVIINCEESDTGEYSVESLQEYIGTYIEECVDRPELDNTSYADMVADAIEAYKGGAR